MSRSRFTEEVIVSIVKEWQAGANTKELCNKYGITRQTFRHWTSRYGTHSQAKQQKMVLPSAKESSAHPKSAGRKLRQVRQELGITIFQIVKDSQKLAVRYHDRHLVIWTSTLYTIEAGVHLPTVYQLYALSVIYGRSVSDILSFYGLGW